MPRTLRILLVLSLFATGIESLNAQGTEPPAATADSAAKDGQATKPSDSPPNSASQVDPKLRAQLRSPRSTMQTFLEAVNEDQLGRAADCLDFSDRKIPENVRASAGGALAFKLKSTIDRLVRVDLSQIPDGENETQSYLLAYQASEMGDEKLGDAGLIEIARSQDGLWRFSPATVAQIDELYDRWESKSRVNDIAESRPPREPFSVWLGKQFHEDLRKTHFLFPDYQWINIFVLILFGVLMDIVVRAVLRTITATWLHLRRGEQEREQKRLWRPVGLFVQTLIWYVGTTVIGLPIWALTILLGVLKAVAVLAAIWTVFLLIDFMTKVMQKKAEATETKFDDLIVPLMSKSLKFIAICLGVVICAEAFDWKITGLLAGVGIGGMALALASQDAVSNLFGSLTVLLDRPFEVGDWIITKDIEGTVETVGFRSTRVRTFYNSLVTVPNSNLTTAVVDNMGKRRYRRIKTVLTLSYDATPEQVDAFCEGLRELIRRHPYTRKDYFHVYLNELSGSSLDVLLYCFLECPDWSMELRERHRLLVDILKLAEQLGVEFAFPTRTLHMRPEATPDEFDFAALGDPSSAGKRAAAKIAGPLLAGEQRPGGVEFTDPTEFEDL